LTSSVPPIDASLTRNENTNAPAEQAPQPYIERIVERIIERPMRRRLPDTRRSITHHFNVAGHEGYLTVGQYDDGSPGELFITMSKEGSTIGGLMDSLGTAISVALQYGVPIESLVTKFAHQRFEPMGMTTNRDIPFAKSLVDYIFRWMGMEFIPGYREANAPPRSQGSTKSADTPSHATQHAGDTRSVSVKEDKQWSEIESLQTSFKNGHSHAAGANGSGASNRMSEQTPLAASRLSAESNGAAKTDVTLPNGLTTVSGHISAASMIVETHSVMDRSVTILAESASALLVNPLDQSNAALMGDAPACDGCGSITVRNGSCYKCMNCGNSMGCS
jgi:ribonucleoside-diphosphate reductase alpha chain